MVCPFFSVSMAETGCPLILRGLFTTGTFSCLRIGTSRCLGLVPNWMTLWKNTLRGVVDFTVFFFMGSALDKQIPWDEIIRFGPSYPFYFLHYFNFIIITVFYRVNWINFLFSEIKKIKKIYLIIKVENCFKK